MAEGRSRLAVFFMSSLHTIPELVEPDESLQLASGAQSICSVSEGHSRLAVFFMSSLHTIPELVEPDESLQLASGDQSIHWTNKDWSLTLKKLRTPAKHHDRRTTKRNRKSLSHKVLEFPTKYNPLNPTGQYHSPLRVKLLSYCIDRTKLCRGLIKCCEEY